MAHICFTLSQWYTAMVMYLVMSDLAMWAKLMWVSGAAISFQKSFYIMLIWDFKPNGEATLCENKDMPPDTVTVKDPSNPDALSLIYSR
eukprot:scaffold572131_cov126-Attheya_sp.AAC.1